MKGEALVAQGSHFDPAAFRLRSVRSKTVKSGGASKATPRYIVTSHSGWVAWQRMGSLQKGGAFWLSLWLEHVRSWQRCDLPEVSGVSRPGQSLMDGHTLKVVSRIVGADVHHAEHRAVGRHLDVKAPPAARTAGQACCTAAVGI